LAGFPVGERDFPSLRRRRNGRMGLRTSGSH